MQRRGSGSRGAGGTAAAGSGGAGPGGGGTAAAVTVPAHKVIPGTGGAVTVDAFRYAHPGVKAYFLTHAHSDHYTGLSEAWCAGPVYCSELTARLVAHLTGVSTAWLRPLPLGRPVVVEGLVEVTLVDANHCPGAVQLLFRVLPRGGGGGAAGGGAGGVGGVDATDAAKSAGGSTRGADAGCSSGAGAVRYLHCGDMRYSPAMQSWPQLGAWRGCEGVFLDTTYCQPKHTFPTQDEAVDYVASQVAAMWEEDQREAAAEAAGTSGPVGAPAAAAEEGQAAVQRALQQTGPGKEAAVGAACDGSAPRGAEAAAPGPPFTEPVGEPGPGSVEGEGGGGSCPTEREVGSGGSGRGPFRRLYLISTYVIGKERILLRIHERTGLRIHVSSTKLDVLRLLLPPEPNPDPDAGVAAAARDGLEAAGAAEHHHHHHDHDHFQQDQQRQGGEAAAPGEAARGQEAGHQWLTLPGGARRLSDVFTDDPAASPVHVVGWGTLGETWPYFRPNFVNMQRAAEIMGARCVVGFVPTGWTYEMKRSVFSVHSKGALSVHLVPYSEHSSYPELLEYVKWLRPRQVIPTVGVKEGDREGERARAAMLARFRSLVDETASKARFLAAMGGGGARRQQQRPADAGAAKAGAAGGGGGVAAAGAGGGGGAAAVSVVQAEVVQLDQDFEDDEEGEEAVGEEPAEGGQPLEQAPDRAQRPEPPCGTAAQKQGTATELPPAAVTRPSSVGRLPVGDGADADVVVLISDEDDDDDDSSRRGGGEGGACGNTGAAGGEPGACTTATAERPAAQERRQQRQQQLGRLDRTSLPPASQARDQGAGGDVDACGHAVGPTPGSAGAIDGYADCSGSAGGNDANDGAGGDDAVSQLMAVIGGAANRQQAQQLLMAARGDLAAAVNRFFDGGGAAASGGGVGGRPQPGSSSPSPKVRGRGRGAAASHGRGGGGSAGEGRPAKRPKLSPQGGAAPGTGSQAGVGGAGQRSITGFFGLRPKQEPQQPREQSQPAQRHEPKQGRQQQEEQAPSGSQPSLGRQQARPAQQRGQGKAEPFPEEAGVGAGTGAAAGVDAGTAALTGGTSVRAASGGGASEAAAAAPAVKVEPGAQPSGEAQPDAAHNGSHVTGPASGVPPGALEAAGGTGTLSLTGEDGSSSPPAAVQPPSKRLRLGLPRYSPTVPVGAPAPAASPTVQAAPAYGTTTFGDGETASAAAHSTPGKMARTGNDVVELPDTPGPRPVSNDEGGRAGAGEGIGCVGAAALHPFFTRGKTQSPSASGRISGARGRAGRGGGGSSDAGRAGVRGGASASAAPGAVGGEVAPPRVKQEPAEADGCGGDAGGDIHQAETPQGQGAARQVMSATLQPATAPAAPASTSAAAATAADAATAAAALAMSWEACREALLLPLERYDPVRHACWGPAHCGDGGAAAANSTSSAAASAAGAASGRGPTPYLHVALCLSALSSTTKRLAISDALTNMFRSVLAAADDPGRDLVAALYLVTGRIAPEYDKTELNVGGATVSGALQAATGASAARLKQLYREHGDLGDVAAACRRTQSTLRNPAPLLCGRLLAALRDVAADKGQGVAARRQAVVLGLLRACRDVEVRFLVRTLISNLRVGANWRSVLAPLGRAVLLHQRATAAVAAAADGSATTAAVQSPAPVKGSGGGSKAGGGGNKGGGGGGSKAAAARQRGAAAEAALGCSKAELEAAGAAVLEAYHTCPNFEILVPVLLRHGIEGLRTRCGLTLGVPLKPMLANACAGVADGLLQLQSASPAAVAVASAGAAAGGGTGGARAGAAAAMSTPPSAPPASSSSSSSWSPLVLPPFLVEYKYDGRRAQIHLLPDGRVAIFSRNCEDVTDAHPDVCAMVRHAAAGPAAEPGEAAGPEEPAAAEGAAAARVPAQPPGPTPEAGMGTHVGAGENAPAADVSTAGSTPASTTQEPPSAVAPAPAAAFAAAAAANHAAAGSTRSLILDAEVVAVEWLSEEELRAAAEAAEAEGAPPPPAYRLKAFQELATRARGQVEQHQVTVQVCVFVFDLLEWNGTSLLHRPLRERRSLLPAALPGMSPGRVMLATAVELQPLQPLQPSAVDREDGEEGPAAEVPVRMWPAPGEPGARRLEEVASAAAALHAAAAAAAAAVPAATAGKPRRRRPPATAAAAAATASDAAAHAAAPRKAAPAVAEARIKLEPCGEDPAAAAVAHAPAPAAAAPAVVELLSSDEDGPGSEGPYGRPHADDTGAPPAPEHSKAAAVGGHDPAAAAAQQPPCQPGPPSMGASRAVMDMLLQSFNTGAEGLMLKRLDGASAYEPSRRSEAWIKVKRDYCEGLRDSVDVVPIGAWYGQGRKVKWFSPFLLAVWDPVREEFQSLCRCMSGFSDQFYAAAKERLGATIIPGPKPYYNTGERCSVWFEPTEVWELRGADLTLSPVHRAASGRLHTERGVGMRFPRFIRVRDDKRPEDATTPDDIVHLYNKQTRKVVVGERGGGDVGRAAGAARPATGCGGAAAVQAQGAQGAGASKRSGRGRDSEDGSTDDGTMREDARKQAREVHGLDDDDHDEGEGQNECGKSKQVEL